MCMASPVHTRSKSADVIAIVYLHQLYTGMNGIPLQSSVIEAPSLATLHSGILKLSSSSRLPPSLPKLPEESVTFGTVPPDGFLVNSANTSPDSGASAVS